MRVILNQLQFGCVNTREAVDPGDFEYDGWVEYVRSLIICLLQIKHLRAISILQGRLDMPTYPIINSALHVG